MHVEGGQAAGHLAGGMAECGDCFGLFGAEGAGLDRLLQSGALALNGIAGNRVALLLQPFGEILAAAEGAVDDEIVEFLAHRRRQQCDFRRTPIITYLSGYLPASDDRLKPVPTSDDRPESLSLLADQNYAQRR